MAVRRASGASGVRARTTFVAVSKLGESWQSMRGNVSRRKGVKTQRMGPHKEGLDAASSLTMAVSVWVEEVGVEAAAGNCARVCAYMGRLNVQ